MCSPTFRPGNFTGLGREGVNNSRILSDSYGRCFESRLLCALCHAWRLQSAIFLLCPLLNALRLPSVIYRFVSCHQVPDLEYFKTRRPIRVLSLFDGIGTGKHTKSDVLAITSKKLVHLSRLTWHNDVWQKSYGSEWRASWRKLDLKRWRAWDHTSQHKAKAAHHCQEV